MTTIFDLGTALTHQNASATLSAGIAAINAGQTMLSFKNTQHCDSSAVACLLVWQRHAQQRGIDLKVQDVPSNLSHLIALYGVTSLLN